MPVLITGTMIVLTFVSLAGRPGEVPVWSNDESLLLPAPFEPERRYLALYTFADVSAAAHSGGGTNAALRPGNMPMYAGLEVINGYSPLGLASLKNVFRFDPHGPLEEERDARRILAAESGPHQLLEHLGVGGLIVREELAREYAALLAARGWRAVARIGPCILLHRGQAKFPPLFSPALAAKTSDPGEAYAAILGRETDTLPVVLLTPGERGVERYGARAISAIEESRTRTSFLVRGKGPKALVVFRRPWLPGWQATIAGKPVPILRASMIQPALEIPADAEGEVRLFYRPRSLVAGAWLAAIALAVMGGWAVRVVRRGSGTQ